MDENAIVEWIKKNAAAPRSRDLILGIGDDCAIFRPRRNEDLVFKIDPLIESVHFLPDAPPRLVGARALARSLSDIAAMGAEPRFCLVSLSLGPDKDERWLKEFFRGLLRLARATGTVLAGGDLSHSIRETHVEVTVCGAVPKDAALRRDGAKPGHAIYVSGKLGKPWDRPIQPRLALGVKLRGIATSCMDISDGLSLDLARLCKASKLSARLDRVPVFPGATLERALHGGEDYELLFTVPTSKQAPRGAIRIGTMERGSPGEVFFEGTRLVPQGYDHFTTSGSPSGRK
jgi:thiamine-monophosphate kinase